MPATGRSPQRERFTAGVGVITSIVNYVIYSAILLALPAVMPLAALVIASVGAMVFSYFGYSRLVFTR